MDNIPNGETRSLPNPAKIVCTQGVMAIKGQGFTLPNDDYLFPVVLQKAVAEQYNKEPDVDLKGGNDKYFFTLTFRGKKLFAAVNEVGGLTVMLPEEY